MVRLELGMNQEVSKRAGQESIVERLEVGVTWTVGMFMLAVCVYGKRGALRLSAPVFRARICVGDAVPRALVLT